MRADAHDVPLSFLERHGKGRNFALSKGKKFYRAKPEKSNERSHDPKTILINMFNL